jgi:hypothetical protein
MKSITLTIFSFLTLLPSIAFADECPADGEVVITSPYKISKDCPAATIIIEGDRNPEKYETCLGDVPSASEKISIRGKDNKTLPLPTVNSLLPPDKPNEEDFKSRLWIVVTLDDKPDVKCVGTNVISIGFWSGGNCRWCARAVDYTIDNNGHVKSAKFCKGC